MDVPDEVFGRNPHPYISVQCPDGQGAGFLFFLPHRYDQGNIAHLGLPDFLFQPFVGCIHLYPQPFCLQRGFHGFCEIGQIIVHRQENRLDRGQPQGEFSCEMFHQDPEKPLDGAENGPVDHDGPMFFIVPVLVGEIEPFRQGHVELDGAALPGAFQGVPDVAVDFGAVKGTIPFVDHVLLAVGFKGVSKA